MVCAPAWPQIIQNTAGGTLNATAAFGTLTPATGTTVTTRTINFRLRNSAVNGYRLSAVATFTFTPTAAQGGGDNIAASDVGVGITAVVPGAQAITPRVDTITSGYSYNPGSVAATDGLTPFTGSGSGRAHLGNLASSTQILSGPRIGTSTGGNRFLTVTMVFGIARQYFTPGTMSSVVTLTISNAP